MSKLNYYDILGVPFKATIKQIQQSFREKIKITHPDVNKSENAEEQTRKLIEAYNTLKNPNSREQYDLSIGIFTSELQNSKESRYEEESYESKTSYDEFSKQFDDWYEEFIKNNPKYFNNNSKENFNKIKILQEFKCLINNNKCDNNYNIYSDHEKLKKKKIK